MINNQWDCREILAFLNYLLIGRKLTKVNTLSTTTCIQDQRFSAGMVTSNYIKFKVKHKFSDLFCNLLALLLWMTYSLFFCLFVLFLTSVFLSLKKDES